MAPSADFLHTARQNRTMVDILKKLMTMPELAPFRLVGGTNLALVHDHRLSCDLDLFTDAEWGSLDFSRIESVLKENFPYVEPPLGGPTSFGWVYFVGNSKEDCVKLDLMYTDPFQDPAQSYGDIRLASDRDMAAMKIQAVNTGPRKKDFWDIHLLLEQFSLGQMLDIHQSRHPYEHDREELLDKLEDFAPVEDQPDPDYFLGKNWDDIKLDIIDEVEKLRMEE